MSEHKTVVAAPNGWTKIVVGFLWAALFGGIMFMGSGVVANDNKHTDKESEIIKDVSELKAVVFEMRGQYSSINSKIDELLRRSNEHP